MVYVQEQQPLPGSRVKEIREKLGLTQHQLAKLVGVTGMTVHRWEHEQTRGPGGATAQMLLQFAKAADRRKANDMKKRIVDWLFIGGAMFVVYKLLESSFSDKE